MQWDIFVCSLQRHWTTGSLALQTRTATCRQDIMPHWSVLRLKCGDLLMLLHGAQYLTALLGTEQEAQQ